MSGSRKLILFAAAALLCAIAIDAGLLFDIDSYKAKIESAASNASGLDVRIRGKMGISLFPFGLSARDILVSGKKREILSGKELRIGVELLPLLRREVMVTECRLVRPSLRIEKDHGGKYNFEGKGQKKEGERGGAFGIGKLTISKGAIVFIDRKTNEQIDLKDIDATVSDVRVGDLSGSFIKNISLKAKVKCGTVRRKTLEVDHVRAAVTAEKGVFRVPLSMDVFGGKGSGEAVIDFSRPAGLYKVDIKVSKLDFASLGKSFGSKKSLGGKGELEASLKMKAQNPLAGMDGTFSLKGNNLVMYTMDLDKVLSKVEGTQKLNLADLGAFFVAGPLGTAATRGYRYGDLYAKARSGEGRIREMVSDWKIRNGIARAADCALATDNHRVALKGNLDLVNSRYDGVIIALLDDRGCAKFSQKISGPFGSPTIGAVSTVQSLVGPVLNLFGKARDAVDGRKCEVFYSGSVQPAK